MDLLIKYGPHIVGLLVAILGMVFFMVRFLLGRVYGGMDLALTKCDQLDRRVKTLEIMAAHKADSTMMVSRLMGGGK